MTASNLEWTYFPTDLDDFCRTPILISGSDNAILVDGGFTLNSGRSLVEKITASGKNLAAIFITCADPDYYFGLGPVRSAFPAAKILATPTTTKAIADTVAHKIDVWTPRLGDNGPKAVSDTVIPTAWPGESLMLDGVRIDIQTAKQANRFNLWIDSISAILGGVQILSGIHVWMADSPTVMERELWIDSLDEMIARKPLAALPGHMAPGSPTGTAAIEFTRRYLKEFDEELPRAKDADALIGVMRERYPNLAMDWVLELSAKVCKGEATWP